MAFKCTDCADRLADFLLDELPESEAVLVQEHLNLCLACMKTYKELKGTGRALQAVPSMRPVEGSPEFKQAVRAQAVVELGNILNRLPPDKRLKIEARRAARLSQLSQSPVPKRAVASWCLVGAAALGVAVLGAVLFYPFSGPPPGERLPIGQLSVAGGTVEQFYQRAYEPHTPVSEGKTVLPGDSFSTADKGCARFDMGDGTSLFLGPASQLTFRVQPPGNANMVVVLERGEMGVQRVRHPVPAGDDEAQPEPQYEVRCEAGTVIVLPGAHAFLKVAKAGREFSGELIVFAGSADVLNRSGRQLGTVSSYHRAALTSAETAAFSAEPQEKAHVPAWRLEVVSQGELAALLGAQVKVLGRPAGGVEAEVLYTGRDRNRGQRDWLPEPTGFKPGEKVQTKDPVRFVTTSSLTPPPASAFSLPPGARARHIVPFGAPLAMDLTLARESRGDLSFAVGVLGTSDGGIAIDVARDAVIQVREKCRTARNASVPVRDAAGKLERLRIEIASEKGGFAAQLSSPAGKSNSLPLPSGKAPISGKLWLQSLGDSVSFDEVRITGLVPADWLREKLSR
jgi:hypothetical protein